MTDNRLWYTGSAAEWTSALPMGNGHLGAMAYGGEEGRFDLSEVTCWSGAKQDSYLGDLAKKSMKQAREALLAGEIDRAEELLGNCLGIKRNYGTQLPLAILETSIEETGDARTRELDLLTGICLDILRYPDRTICRESFISSPDKVMAIRITAGGEKLPSVRIRISGHDEPCRTENGSGHLAVSGKALEKMHSDGLHGTEYTCKLRLLTDGSVEPTDNGNIVTGARQIVCLLTAATSLFYTDHALLCSQRIEQAETKGFDRLREVHVAEHSGWMDRCSVDLPDGSLAHLPTDERLANYTQTRSDNSLIALAFQYGRYLLLNSSRPDSLLPAALQGVWNDNRACRMGWTDDMHLDINTQMNYYPAETTGLGECCMPLFDYLKNIVKPEGEKIAADLYGANGWMAHTITNAYGWAAPGWDLSFGIFVTGGAWAATHIWQHYLFTGDREFLLKYWTTLRGSAEFLLDILMEEPQSGQLVIVPSYSPENSFLDKGKAHYMTIGSTADMLITRYLFEAVVKADAILAKNDGLTASLEEALQRMTSFETGKHGQLKEWFYDYDEALPDHRHTSHLISVYPFGQIDPDDTPLLADAAQITLQRRLGDNAADILWANWAGALLILYSARMKDGESAGKFIVPMLASLARENLMITHECGIYELDGNTGFTAAVAEMLLQSHRSEIHILPALPAAWRNGSYKDLIAVGGHKVSVQWSENSTVKAVIQAASDGSITLRYKNSICSAMYCKNQKKEFILKDGRIEEAE
ncbi:MAG: glycoside hydrolase family 95 protein [Saccharofermentanales bacterium]